MKAARIRGEALANAIRNGYLETIVPRLVATSPLDAVDRIAAVFGTRPARSGRNTTGIVAFREWLFDHTGNGRAKDALLVVAPHTHWDDRLPIVYRADRADSAERYLVGPSSVDPDALYRPVSFVFAEDGARPYEWADPSIVLPDEELAELYAVIEAASKRFEAENWPLGLSINFRFKPTLFHTRLVGNVELEIEGDPDDQSEIVIDAPDAQRSRTGADILQVAWHCYSDRCHALSEAEMAIVAQLRALSDTVDGAEWARVAAMLAARTLEPNRD